ncbi:serine/threonine-protein phosphatase BSL1-like [Bidens hawaiensis]|uniref:serine/threonine-protein phosphatase BSL1-like n=1 Tax=Bidens hawaiensis TaxID=980011 RepID=UPI00404985A7
MYVPLDAHWDADDDAPGPRCGHTLTAVAQTKSHGPRLILFGGATAIEGGAAGAGIRLAGVTNSVHAYDIITKKWTRNKILIRKNLCRIRPAGEAPSPRAAHAAAAVGTMVVFQGGIGPAGHSTDDLYVLDLSNDKYKWHRVVVQGHGPGPRYGHVMDLVSQRYLVTFSGNDGKKVLSDTWTLDTAQKPYAWLRLNTEGDIPSARMYATASARSDGMLLLCGGRDTSGVPLADAYGLLMHKSGQWEWTLAPGVSPSSRYQHAAVCVGTRLHVTGGALRGGRVVDGGAAIAVLDTAAGVWLDRHGLVTSSHNGNEQTEDPSLDLMRRCRHAMSSIDSCLYVYGGLKGDVLLGDFLVAENSSFFTDTTNPGVTSEERGSNATTPRANNWCPFDPVSRDDGSESHQSTDLSVDKDSTQTQAEANAAYSTWQAAQAHIANPTDVMISNVNSQTVLTNSEGGAGARKVQLHPRAVVIAREAIGNLGGLVRQLSLDHFENESKRMMPFPNDMSSSAKRFMRQKSPQGLHKKVIATLLKPRNWSPPADRRFFLDAYEVGELCYAAEQIFSQEPTVLDLKVPIKVFGDLHGQFTDLMRLFDEYGFPSSAGDITYIDYLFLGDYVDRGQHSLETITLLLALKINYPQNFHLIRGNHEAADVNALFGFRPECIERMGENDGIWAWKRFNQLFNHLPLAALIDQKIICMHGGIGRSIHSVEQIEKIERPTNMDAGSVILMDLLWSDPTENDSVEGLRPNARGPGLVTFGPDRVIDFCKRNSLQLIIRAHECVMDGFERFAQGQLITLFSATNYCGTANNAGALLVIGRGLVVVPKLIHPLPPPLEPEASPTPEERHWMQVMAYELFV